jgi:parvulin-like peptidyl-prolyl isomerase
MKLKSTLQRAAIALIIAAPLTLTACSNDPAPVPQVVITPEIFSVTVNPQATPTPVPPTPEPTPTVNTLAARVNDQPITLDQFNAEMARYLFAAAPVDANGDDGQRAAQLKDVVLDALVEQVLIEQEATRNGIVISDQQIKDELAVARDRAGGDAQYQAWLAANQLTEQDARELARRDLLTNAMRDRVLTQLPRTADYVHAYHIVVATEVEAQRLMQQLQNGAKFTALAQTQSLDDSTRANGGDLGWITRGTGSLLWSEVEDATFALQPGETSAIVPSPVGFHIVKVTERETRALTDVDTAYLQEQTLTKWIADLKASAKIKRYV